MDQELKAKWVKALRSGKYVQGPQVLFSPMRQMHCCLGVLCEVAGARRNQIAMHTYPKSVVGFEDVLDAEIADELAEMNDDGMPFEMIAGLINEAL